MMVAWQIARGQSRRSLHDPQEVPAMPRLISLALALVMLGTTGIATTGGWATPAEPAAVHDFAIHAFPLGEEPEMTALGTFGHVIALHPGETVVLAVGVYDFERCGVSIQCFIPVNIATTWSVGPAGGAGIDPAKGELAIDGSVPSGSQFTVSATVEEDRQAVTAEVHVYTPEGNPFVGFWREEAQLACDDGEEVAPALRVEELVFAADGQFAVTWQPFESYVDYWGTYAFDLNAGTIELTITSGNFVPGDVDGQGRFKVEEGKLVLTDVWLGTSHSSKAPPNCGHRFSRG
jgi:hypothetical protein